MQGLQKGISLCVNKFLVYWTRLNVSPSSIRLCQISHKQWHLWTNLFDTQGSANKEVYSRWFCAADSSQLKILCYKGSKNEAFLGRPHEVAGLMFTCSSFTTSYLLLAGSWLESLGLLSSISKAYSLAYRELASWVFGDRSDYIWEKQVGLQEEEWTAVTFELSYRLYCMLVPSIKWTHPSLRD